MRLILAHLARVWAALIRLRTLPLAIWLFARCERKTLLPARFAGFKLFVDVGRSSTEQLLWLVGERMVAERWLLATLFTPGMRVADVGANLGYYTLLFSQAAGPVGRIDCFEPEPNNFAILERNVRENGLAQVHLHQIAIGDRDGTVRLAPGLNSTILSTGADAETVEVPVRRLDALLEGPLDLLKIDIDGYEGFALRGAETLLREARPNLFLELHPALIPAPDTIGGLVAGLNRFYPNLEFWEPAPEDNLLGLLASRYLPGRGVRRIEDVAGLLAACENGERRDTFWAIGRNGRATSGIAEPSD